MEERIVSTIRRNRWSVMNDQRLMDLAIDIAIEAGELLVGRFRSEATGIETKSTPTDVVSDADRDSETLILARISAARPEDGVIAEEGDERTSGSGFTWIIDPLDGTVNFLFGIPVWGVSIAIHDSEGPLVGVVHDPNRRETFAAERGAGAELNGSSITVSDRSDLATALIGTGFSYDAKARQIQAERFPKLLPNVRDIRRAGSAAIDVAWLACGRLDGFFEAPMMLWDRAAGEVLITEAGGVISPLPAPFGAGDGVVAAGPALHDKLRRLVLSS